MSENVIPPLLPANIVELAKITDPGSSRYALEGVHIVVSGDSYTCEATDTRRAMVVKGPLLNEPTGKPRIVRDTTTHKNKRLSSENRNVDCLISARDLKRMRDMSVDKTKVLGFNQNCESVCVAVDGIRSIETAKLEGRFPKIKDCVPTAKPVLSILFNAALLADTLKVLSSISSNPKDACVMLELHGEDMAMAIRLRPNYVRNDQEVIAIVMPVSSDR